jgi:hypothetical protein
LVELLLLLLVRASSLFHSRISAAARQPNVCIAAVTCSFWTYARAPMLSNQTNCSKPRGDQLDGFRLQNDIIHSAPEHKNEVINGGIYLHQRV